MHNVEKAVKGKYMYIYICIMLGDWMEKEIAKQAKKKWKKN